MYTHPHPSVLVVAVVCIVMFAALGTEPERRGSAGYSVWRRRRCHPIIPHNASGSPSISSDRYDCGGDGTIPHGELNEHTVPCTYTQCGYGGKWWWNWKSFIFTICHITTTTCRLQAAFRCSMRQCFNLLLQRARCCCPYCIVHEQIGRKVNGSKRQGLGTWSWNNATFEPQRG